MSKVFPILKAHCALAFICLVFALGVALVWVPLDSASGMIVKVRRQVNIGDALAPTLAACVIGLGALLMLLERERGQTPAVTRKNLTFVMRLGLVLFVGFFIMRWGGEAAVWIARQFGNADLSYRSLRDTAPWKYIGFFFGGTFIITTFIAFSQDRLTSGAVLLGVLATVALILCYDLPFDDLLLPPNGDV